MLAHFSLSTVKSVMYSLAVSYLNRRWFSIQNNQLVYQKKFKVGIKNWLGAVWGVGYGFPDGSG